MNKFKSAFPARVNRQKETRGVYSHGNEVTIDTTRRA